MIEGLKDPKFDLFPLCPRCTMPAAYDGNYLVILRSGTI